MDVIFCSGGIFDASSLLLWYKSTILHDFFPITNLRAEIGLENGAAVCSTPFQKMYFCVYGCVCWFFAIMLRVVVVICATYRLKIETFSPGEVCYLTVMSCAIEMMLCKYIPIVVSPLHKE